jgi:hypothetical protein
MPSVWQKTCLLRQFCHSWRKPDERMLSAMTIILLLALVSAFVLALEHHHRTGDRRLHERHGADSSIASTHLDHDFDRVAHDLAAHA